MAKIVVTKGHFMFLRALVEEFIDVDDGETPEEVMDLANEVKTILSYSRYFKEFSIEIGDNSNGDGNDYKPS